MQVSSKSQLYEATTTRGIVRYLGPHNPALLKKVIRVLIMDTHDLFHVTVNPPPLLPIPGGGTLSELYLVEQYNYCVKLLKFFIKDIVSMCEDFHMVPEKTKEGVIHMHCVIKLVKGRIDTDLKRMFWDIFNIVELPPQQKRAALKSMVHITPITDESIIEYLFHKDKKDYETIYTHKGVNDTYLFDCVSLQEVPTEETKKLVSDGGDSTDEDSWSEPQSSKLILKKRVIIPKKK